MATSLLKWKENIQFKENKGYCFKHLYLKPLKKYLANNENVERFE
jgi:hypothetical protein